MPPTGRRYVVIPKDREPAGMFETLEGAEQAALAFGEGCDLVDTNAALYQPLVQQVCDNELVFLPYGGWGPKVGFDGSLVEAARTGYAPLVQAYLLRSADVKTRDANGATALIWAVARGNLTMVEALLKAGADPDGADHKGVTPRRLAEQKGSAQIIACFDKKA